MSKKKRRPKQGRKVRAPLMGKTEPRHYLNAPRKTVDRRRGNVTGIR